MGQKVHPVGFRLGVTRTWDSKWFAAKDYQRFLHEDLKIRMCTFFQFHCNLLGQLKL